MEREREEKGMQGEEAGEGEREEEGKEGEEARREVRREREEERKEGESRRQEERKQERRRGRYREMKLEEAIPEELKSYSGAALCLTSSSISSVGWSTSPGNGCCLLQKDFILA